MTHPSDDFVEAVTLRTVADRHIETVFRFEGAFRPTHAHLCRAHDSRADAKMQIHSSSMVCHTERFPSAIVDVLQESGAVEFSVSMARGLYHDSWGSSPRRVLYNDTNSDPEGAVVTATFPFPRCHHSQIGGDTTTSASWDTGGTITYSAHWPRVYPGMESFWPFLSILPCAHRTGVAALIDPYRVMRGNYMALNLRASARCEAPSGCALGFVLGVHAVERHTLSGSSPRRTLLVSDVFGGVASSFAPCSAATRSHLHLMASLTDHTARGGVGGVVEPRAWSLSALADGHWEISSVAPGEPQRTVAFSLADSPRARDSASAFVAHVNSAVLTPLEWRNSALQRQSFNTFGHASVVMSLPATEVASPRRDMGVTVSCAECEQRSSGFEEPGQELSVTQFVGDCDGFRCRRTHRVQLGDLACSGIVHLTFPVATELVDLYLHTLTLHMATRGDESAVDVAQSNSTNNLRWHLTEHHVPVEEAWVREENGRGAGPRAHQRVAELELTFPGGPWRVATIEYDYDIRVPNVGRWPPDAARGFELGFSTVMVDRLQCGPDDGAPSTGLYGPVYSRGVLQTAPLPDFSMPFNVISLNCTLWAGLIGTMVNILLRRPKEKKNKVLGAQVDEKVGTGAESGGEKGTLDEQDEEGR